MFDTLVPLTEGKAVQMADLLHRGDPAGVRVDPLPVFVVFVSSAARGLPYEVDFVAVGADLQTPVAMLRADREKLTAWTDAAVRLICQTWKERYPPY